jgi:hypothetical protein
MTIPRQILAYVRAQLLVLTGLTEDQVHFPSAIDTPVEGLPELVIFALEDRPTGDGGTDSGGGEIREFDFGVTATVASEDEADTDPLANLIRKVVRIDPSLGGLVDDTTRGPQEWGSGAGSKPTAMTKLVFTSTYYDPSEED